jgi:hypothetical protein
MTLEHHVAFDLDLALPRAEALAFVRDVARSLARATFLEDLHVSTGSPRLVTATLPVNAALMGQRSLPFTSVLETTPDGARLVGQPLAPTGPGWAQVDGDADVFAADGGSRVSYRFRVRVHLHLPEPERWGGRALLRMIEFTARSVLERVIAAFPSAVRAAADEAGGEGMREFAESARTT